MKTKYFTKVEDKYVFNVTLIFWHLLIALASIAIVLSIILLLWSLIPPSEKKVARQAYPEMQQLPAPVEVSLAELNSDKSDQEKPSPEKKTSHREDDDTTQKAKGDTLMEKAYKASFEELKNLIPPSKYSWSGSGYWHYPYGERYWRTYKKDEYRKWIVSQASLENMLLNSYQVSNVENYSEAKQILDAYINIVKILPEEKRMSALKYLLEHTTNSISRTVEVLQALQKVVSKMENEKSIAYINTLSQFGKKNPNDGAPLIEYISTIIDKFDQPQANKTIDNLIESYYSSFNQNLARLKEATDLFIPMLTQIEGESHPEVLLEYYVLYRNKNRDRDNEIAQIEAKHMQQIDEIENQYVHDKEVAAVEYEGRKILKSEFRYKSLLGIGGGILMIVLIGTLLVFLSIQRTVRKIEEKISTGNSVTS